MSSEAVTLLPAETRRIRFALLRWYDKNRRDLPWRRTGDPYAIWVSEIMLQQTRVAAVLEHYREFLKRFPTVKALAEAELAEVLAAWSGLGYYRRARALHEAAKQVAAEHGGQLPDNVEALRSLPGVGRYSSAAIGSIAFGIPAAVVDGNVERVLGRVMGLSARGEPMWVAAQRMLAPERPGDWNQAMMELGATVCLPGIPNCSGCPLQRWCKLPGTSARRPEPPRNKRVLTYGLAKKGKRIYLVQRSASESLMPGMWELPQVEPAVGEVVARHRHSITVTDFEVDVVSYKPNGNRRGCWVEYEKLENLPLTGLARKILRGAKLLKATR